MKTEYRVIFTATFDTAAERDKMYASLKTQLLDVIRLSATAKRADITRDDYAIAEAYVTEKVL